MSLGRNPIAGFETRIRHVAAAGVDLPPAIDELRQRLKDFQRRDSSHAMLDRLADAIIAADPDADLDMLWSASLAEANANPALVADLRDAIRVRVNRAIRATYDAVAEPTFRAIAAQFDNAAQALTACTAIVDVELPADAAITCPPKEQKAWKDAAAAVTELNRLALPLKAAAVLAGICEDTADHDLPLMVDPGPANRRQLWDAWETDSRETKAQRAAASNSPFTPTEPARMSRCGRWAAVISVGATIRACPLDQFSEYRRPQPMIQQVRDGKKQWVDPEADDYQPAEPARFTPPLSRILH